MPFVEYLTTAETAVELELSEARIRQFCQGGRLGRRIGRDWAISRTQLETFRKVDRPNGRPPKMDAD